MNRILCIVLVLVFSLRPDVYTLKQNQYCQLLLQGGLIIESAK